MVLLHLRLTSHWPSLSAIVLGPSSPDLDLYLQVSLKTGRMGQPKT